MFTYNTLGPLPIRFGQLLKLNDRDLGRVLGIIAVSHGEGVVLDTSSGWPRIHTERRDPHFQPTAAVTRPFGSEPSDYQPRHLGEFVPYAAAGRVWREELHYRMHLRSPR
jgi:hypothetical protein